jgi:hypothetical protein
MKKIIVCMLFVFSYVICSSIDAAEVEGVAADTRLFVFKSIGSDFCFRDLGEAYRKAKESKSESVCLFIEEDLSGIGLSFVDVCVVIKEASLADCSFVLPNVDLSIDAVRQFIDATINSPRISLSGCQAVNDENLEVMLDCSLHYFESIEVIGCPLSIDGIQKLASRMKAKSRLHISTVAGADETLRADLSDIVERFNKRSGSTPTAYTEAHGALSSANESKDTESMKSALVQALEVLGCWEAGTEVNRNTIRSAVKSYVGNEPEITIVGTPGVAKCFELVYENLNHRVLRTNLYAKRHYKELQDKVRKACIRFYKRATRIDIDVAAFMKEFPHVYLLNEGNNMAAIELSLDKATASAITRLMDEHLYSAAKSKTVFWCNDDNLKAL